jgi:uncharacterized protein YcfL
VSYVNFAEILIFLFHDESLELQILKIDLQILTNNIEKNGTDLKKNCYTLVVQFHERFVWYDEKKQKKKKVKIN